jgi:hypothetical protein
MQLDLPGIAAAVVRNNMGVGGITLQVRASVRGATATFADTSQSLPVANGPAASAKPWQTFTVVGFGEGERPSLHWRAEADAPSVEPAS